MTEFIWDYRPFYIYSQTPQEMYEVIYKKYHQFVADLDNVNTEPIPVFNPLKEKQLTELELIREVSKVLQVKKEEDIRKSKAAAEEEQPKQEGAEEQAKEEAPAETKPDA